MNIAGKTGYLQAENRNYTSINSKSIKELNIRPETLKLVQERAGNTLELIHIENIENGFLSRTQMAQQVRERINK
jgi:hypothetical protein